MQFLVALNAKKWIKWKGVNVEKNIFFVFMNEQTEINVRNHENQQN